MKKKKIYEQPETAVTRVELESPICSGSAQIENPAGNNFEIEDQKINENFDYTPTGSDWDSKN